MPVIITTYIKAIIFSTVLFPIWTLSFQEISDFVKHIWEAWSGEYFNISVPYIYAVLLTFNVFNLKKQIGYIDCSSWINC
jgi:hypothetical protein